jgi:RNA polymerase sigma-70 factor (ECF subfamily)
VNGEDHDRRPRLVPDPATDEAARLEQLIARTASGHEASFATLYDITSPRVYGLVLRIIRSPELAAEVTQEIYVEVWRHSTQYQTRLGSVLSWVLAIAHHRAVDHVRAATRRSGREDRYGQHEQQVVHDVVWDDVSRHVDVERVRRAMRSLTEVQREALTLAYFGGYTHRQVASMLELPLGTAKTRIRDGLIGLRDALGVEA